MKTHVPSLIFLLALIGCSGGSTPDEGSTPDRGSTPDGGSTPDDDPPASAGTSGFDPAGVDQTDGCDASSPCIEADVTLTDGSTFHFARNALLDTATSSGAHSLRAKDPDRRFSVALYYRPHEVTAGRAYPSKATSEAYVSVTQPNPADPGQIKLSTAEGGSIIFDSVDINAPEGAKGTFDGVTISRPAAEPPINIRLTNGHFRAGPS